MQRLCRGREGHSQSGVSRAVRARGQRSSTREGVAGAHACCVAKFPTIASPFCWRAATVESAAAQRVDISSSTRRAAPRTTRSRPSREVTCSWSRSETHSNPLKSHAEIARWERLREPEIRSGGDVSHCHAHLGVPRGGGYVKTAPRSEEAGGSPVSSELLHAPPAPM